MNTHRPSSSTRLVLHSAAFVAAVTLAACGPDDATLASDEASIQVVSAPTTNGFYCATDELYFDGDCRPVSYFEERTSDGATFAQALGTRRIPACAPNVCAATEVTVIEIRTGEWNAIRLTDDADQPPGLAVAGLRHASGFRIVAEAKTMFLPTIGDSYIMQQVLRPRADPRSPRSSWRMEIVRWRSEERVSGNVRIVCGTDIAEDLAALGQSGECLEVLASSSGSSASCNASGAGWGLAVAGGCSVVGVGATAFFTQPETVITAPVFAGVASGVVGACSAVGGLVGVYVSSRCTANLAIETSEGCALSGGAVPGIITVDRPAVTVSTYRGEDGTVHGGCTVQTEDNQTCSVAADGACSCTTFSSCERVTCDDGYEQDTGDC